MQANEELRYGLAGIPVEDYELELDELWKQLQDPTSDIRQEAELRGIHVEQLVGIQRDKAIALKTDGSPFGAEVTLIVALLPLATATVKALTPIIKDLWSDVLRPRILQKWGGHVLPPKEDKGEGG